MKTTIKIAFALACAVVVAFLIYGIIERGKYGEDSSLSEITVRKFRNGDIVFHTSCSRQSKYIQMGTLSRYSHCGIICLINGKPYVYEAVQSVKITPLEEWIARGKNSRFVVKRLRNVEEILTPNALSLMKKEARKFTGKDYDAMFSWSDSQIYCSELVWKIYDRALGIELCPLRCVQDYPAVKLPKVKRELERRGISQDGTVVAPSDLFRSSDLVTVMRR